ncbi:MAG: PKD domain-containing protein [Pseudomonadota bacterium]
MPRFLFKGFNTGSSVAITAAQGGLTDSASVDTWGEEDTTPDPDPGPGAGTGSLSITAITAGVVTAPAGVWFNVNLSSLSGFVGEDGNPISGPTGGQIYDPRYHEVTYIWDFDDPGTFGTALNMPTVWNNKNVAYGPKVAHVFSAPGTYSVSVWAIDASGNTGVASTTVTVVDADTVYTGGRTIYFDPTSTWADSPPGANQVSTVLALQGACNTLTQPGRVLIARGITQNDFALDLNGEPVVYIGARGTGPRPILTNPNAANNKGLNWGNTASVDQITITGLAQRGLWDSTVAGGGSAQSELEPFDVRRINGDNHFVVYDCDFSGYDWVNIVGDREYVSTTIMSDCLITNWEDYGLFCNQVHLAGGYNRLAVVGCAIVQDVDALGGNPGKDDRDNEHGPIRIQENHEVYLGCLDLFSRNGWAGGQPTPSCQPCVRTNTNGVEGHYYNFDRVCGENGGEAVFVSNPENASQQNLANNYVYDKMLAVGGAVSRTGLFEHSMGGATFRNCIGIIPNVPSEYADDFLQAHNGFKCIPDNPGPGNADGPIRIYNCTILNLRNTANDGGYVQEFSRISGFNNVTVENNILHAPSMDTAVTPDAPIALNTPIAGFTPRFKGLKYTGETVMRTQFANPSTVPQPIPQTGSRALEGTGLGLTAYDDFLTVPRGDPETLGALKA